ncbi:MAG: N-acetyltransferase [Saccharofermentans sp.]|nr:N-acetyltransferase [Saccharofermentans sp.]
MSTKVRQATASDIDCIMPIYDGARVYMAANGNPNQWVDGYPSRDQLLSDISKNQCYVVEVDGKIEGVFVFIIGDDPTYEVIENGSWLNSKPYGTIHRIASSGKVRGIFEQALAFCFGKIDNIRIDTHADNKIMQNKVTSNGFTRCGIIYLASGAPRIAYQKTL